jgi:hypothetical protein
MILGSILLFFGAFNIYYAISNHIMGSNPMTVAIPIALGGLLVYFGWKGRKNNRIIA